jgi:pilus assembly protein CpaE
MSTVSPIKVFITGAANGLAEVREGLADHPEVELVGTAADPSKAGAKLAESSAQVILHGTSATDHVPTAEIESIRSVTAAPIVLVTSASANSILGEALTAGIFDVVLLPQLTDGIVFTIKKAFSLAAGRAGGGPGKTSNSVEGKVVTLFSPKGGAGKTVLACNLAAIFARRHDRRTLLLDLDLQFGDAAIMMGIEPDKTIYDLVMARRELDTDALAGYVTAHQSGVHVLPAPLRPEDAELVTEERLGHLFAVAKESYDVVVVDTPPFFHGPVLSTLDRTDHLILVGTMDVPTIKNIKLTLQTLDLLHYPKERRHLLLNRTGSKVGLNAREIERALDMPISFEVESEREVPVSVNRGVPLALASPRSSMVKSLGEIADKLVPPVRSKDGSSKKGKGGEEKKSRRSFGRS